MRLYERVPEALNPNSIMGNIGISVRGCFMLTLRQVHVFHMDIISAGVSIALTVAINMRVSFKARIADDDHINRTSFRPVRRAAGFTRRLALPPFLPFLKRRYFATRRRSAHHSAYGTKRVAYGQNQTTLGWIRYWFTGGDCRSGMVDAAPAGNSGGLCQQ